MTYEEKLIAELEREYEELEEKERRVEMLKLFRAMLRGDVQQEHLDAGVVFDMLTDTSLWMDEINA